jgi:hypothetical protein
MDEELQGLDWQKVPKEGMVGHHEALRVLLFFNYLCFCFCVVLLFIDDELCFSFFLTLTTLNID